MRVLSLLLYGFAGVMYWKHVCKYANEVEKEEIKKKEEVVVSPKKTVKKTSSKPKKSTATKSKK